MPETYCAPTPAAPAAPSAPVAKTTVTASAIAAPNGFTPVAPAVVPVPCSPSEPE